MARNDIPAVILKSLKSNHMSVLYKKRDQDKGYLLKKRVKVCLMLPGVSDGCSSPQDNLNKDMKVVSKETKSITSHLATIKHIF